MELGLQIINSPSQQSESIYPNHDVADGSKIYLHQFNQAYDETVYLPLSIAYLKSSCDVDEYVKNKFSFGPMIYIRDEIENILPKYDNPMIVGFSLYVWNERISLRLAEEIKKKFTKCVIVFGGPSVPSDSEKFLRKSTYIDYMVHGEGEFSFVELLSAIGKNSNLLDVAGISFLRGGKYYNTGERKRLKDLDEIPSPFLNGTFNELLNDPYTFQGIWETNRGCPFQCSFCYWGSNLKAKISLFSMDRLKSEIDWMAAHEIEFIYAADANFGILARDVDICEMIVQSKINHNYPQSFFINYSKNTDERVFKIAKRFYDYDLCKGTTLSLQSLDDDVLNYIKRRNIKMSAFKSLQRMYREAGVPSYTELILPLPGETLETFVDGLEETLQSGGHDQVYVHLCRLLPNTEMSSEDNRTRFGLKTRLIPIHNHANVGQECVGEKEFEEILIETNTLSPNDWTMACAMSWMVITSICLKTSYFISLYLFHEFGIKFTDYFRYILDYVNTHKEEVPLISKEHSRFNEYIRSLLEGDGSVNFSDVPELFSIRWPIEEVTFIVYSSNKDIFYEEMKIITRNFLLSRNLSFDQQFLDELFTYQRNRLVSYKIDHNETEYHWNFGKFAQAAILNDPVKKLSRETYKSVLSEEYTYDTYHDFLKHHVWYGRRRKRFYYPEIVVDV